MSPTNKQRQAMGRRQQAKGAWRKQLITRLTRGKKPKAWPGGIRAPQEYRVAVSKMRPAPKGTALTKYVRKQLRTYRAVDQAKGPAIYSRSDVYETLHRMGNIQSGRTNEIADFACGVGLVGAKVAGLAQKAGTAVHVTFVDVKPKEAKIAEAMQKEAPDVAFKAVESDFRRINAPTNRFDTTYCRFAIKNMQPDQQNQALREICRVTKRGGVFVLNDMLSPPGLQEFQNAERRAKNSAGGNPTVTHHVPTEREWIRRLEEAGFKVEKVEYTTSVVHTGDWVSSSQVTENGLRNYYKFLQEAKKRWPTAWREYQIKEKTDPKKGPGFEIIYPVIYIKCRKP